MPFGIERGEENTRLDATALALREQKYLEQAAIFEALEFPHEKEGWIVRAARLFPPHAARWAYHFLTVAQLKVDQGEIDAAERIIADTETLHQAALRRIGGEWDPSNRALAESTRAWLLFLKGKRAEPMKGFHQTVLYARESNNVPLEHRGLHMEARALAEPEIMRAYFSRSGAAKQLGVTVQAQALKGVEAALQLDKLSGSRGSPGEAFGVWYKGVLLGLGGDVAGGRQFLEQAESQLRANHYATSALSHAALSRIHFDLMATGDPYTLQRNERDLRDMLIQLKSEKYPYAFADALTTLAFCRMSRGALRTRVDRWEVADLLSVSLLAHPYSEHVLWQIGAELLRVLVAGTFSMEERRLYVNGLQERVPSGEGHFGYLLRWKFDLTPLETLVGFWETK